MKSIKMIAKQFVNDESGQDLIEYALVAAVVSLGAVTTLKPVATAVSAVFSGISGTLTSNTP
jgi:pilus assembly protein Flp/PilA